MKNKISKIIAATMIALACLFTTSLTKLSICAEDTAETVSVTFNFYDADGQNIVYKLEPSQSSRESDSQ